MTAVEVGHRDLRRVEIRMLPYADNLVLIAATEISVQYHMVLWNKALHKRGLVSTFGYQK